MRRRLLLAALCVALLNIHSGRALAATIGLFFDEEGTICDASIPPLTMVDTYVFATPGPEYPEGLTGAEFRIDGFDPAWFTSVVPSLFASVFIGNPIQGGCNIAFSSCQLDPVYQHVLLYTIRILAVNPIPPTILEVQRHSTPSNPNMPCPRLVNCSPPVFSAVCATGMNACINRTQTCCIVATQPSTWSQVKSLYGAQR